MKTDHWFYRIFRDLPDYFFNLMRMPASSVKEYDFEAVELKELATRIDGIYRPRTAGLNYIFLEAQLYQEDKFYRDWMTKIFMYLRINNVIEDWRGLVLFGSRNMEPIPYQGMKEWIDSGRIQRFYLDELPDNPEHELEAALIKLAITKKEEIIQKAHDLVCATRIALENPAQRKKWQWLIEAFLVTNFPRLTRSEIQAMLELNDIRQSTLYQEGIMEGKLEGIMEGKLEGIMEGKLKEKQQTIFRMLAKGRATSEIAEAVDLDQDTVLKMIADKKP